MALGSNDVQHDTGKNIFSACERNVGSTERVASAIVGAGLLLFAIKRRGLLPAMLGGSLLYRGASGHCELYHRVGINTAARKSHPQTSVPHRQGIKITSAVIIDRSAAELYAFWRDLKNLLRFVSHLETLETENGRSHWTFRSLAGKRFSWDAEIINDVPNELLAWRSLEGSDLDHAGSVRFEPAPGGRGTSVKVTLEYRPPAGKVGAAAAKLFGADPEQVVATDLRRFKQLMEAGELASVEGQPQGGNAYGSQ